MLDSLTRYFPVGALTAVLVATLFNVGYFSVVGLHFIGVMDLSNVVYSFALAFTAVSGVGALGYILGSFSASLELDRIIGQRRLYAIAFAGLLLVLLIYFLNTEFDPERKLFFGLIIAAAVVANIGYLAYSRWHIRKRDYIVIGAATLIGAVGIVLFGALQGLRQAYSTDITYDVVTKQGAITGVRMIRTSSSGILFSKDQTIIFMPASEISAISLDSRRLFGQK
jgi:hypothetical protein